MHTVNEAMQSVCNDFDRSGKKIEIGESAIDHIQNVCVYVYTLAQSLHSLNTCSQAYGVIFN